MRAPGPSRRPWGAVAAAALVAPVLGLLVVAPAAATDQGPDQGAGEGADEATPLTVSPTAMAPSAVSPRGDLALSGSVRNDSDEVWTDVNVAPFVGDTPITTRAELGLAAGTPEQTAVGSRLDAPGTFVGLGDLVPGEELDFQLSSAG